MKGTAGFGPAAGETLDAGPDELLSLTQASRRSGVGTYALRAAIASGRLSASRGQRPYERGRYGTRTGWVIADVDLRRWLESLDECLYPGCDRIGAGPTGCCSGPHAQGVFMKGVARPDIGAKISETRRGRSYGPRGYCAAVRASWARILASPAGDELRASRSARMRDWWRTGTGAPPVVLKLKGRGRTRQRYFGRWSATKPPAKGGRPRGRPKTPPTPDQIAAVEGYAGRGWGYRSITAASDPKVEGLSAYQVRRIVAAYLERQRASQPTLFQRT